MRLVGWKSRARLTRYGSLRPTSGSWPHTGKSSLATGVVEGPEPPAESQGATRRLSRGTWRNPTDLLCDPMLRRKPPLRLPLTFQ